MYPHYYSIQVPNCKTVVFVDVMYKVQCFFFEILHAFTHLGMRTPTASKFLKICVLVLHKNCQGRKLHILQ